MNRFINQLDELTGSADSFTEQDESELIEYLLEHSAYTDLDSFVIENISYNDAFEYCTSTDDFIPDCINHLDMNDVNIPPNPDSINSFAYTLAYDNPEFGTKLLDELLYYRSKGRI